MVTIYKITEPISPNIYIKFDSTVHNTNGNLKEYKLKRGAPAASTYCG